MRQVSRIPLHWRGRRPDSGAATLFSTLWITFPTGASWIWARTRVRKGRCVFLVNNSCSIHADPHYPAVCKGFPYVDAETGGPYLYDQTICPEFERRDDLHEIRRRHS